MYFFKQGDSTNNLNVWFNVSICRFNVWDLREIETA